MPGCRRRSQHTFSGNEGANSKMWCQEDHLQGNEFAVSCSTAMVNRHACRGLKSSRGLAELWRYKGKMSLKLQAHCHIRGRLLQQGIV